MKMIYIVAPAKEQQGKGPLDFCWTTPGEPVVIGMTCSSGYPSDGCGCRRAFKGVSSRRATTIGIVAEVDIETKELAVRELVSFGIKDPTQKQISVQQEEIENISKEAVRFPIGTRVGVSITDIVDIKEASEFEKLGWGW